MTKYIVNNAVNKKDVTKNQKSARLKKAETVIRQRRHDILSFVLDHIDNGKLSVNTELSRKQVFDLFRSHCPKSDISQSSYFFKLFYKSLGGFVVTTQHFIRIKVIGMYHFKKDMQWRLEQIKRLEQTNLRKEAYIETLRAKARKQTQKRQECKQVVDALLALSEKPPRLEKPMQLPQEYTFTAHKENGTFGFKIHALNSTVRIMHSEHPEVFLPSQIVKINDNVLMSGTTLLDVQKTMRTLNKVTLRLKPVVPGPSILKKRKFQQPGAEQSHPTIKPSRPRTICFQKA